MLQSLGSFSVTEEWTDGSTCSICVNLIKGEEGITFRIEGKPEPDASVLVPEWAGHEDLYLTLSVGSGRASVIRINAWK